MRRYVASRDVPGTGEAEFGIGAGKAALSTGVALTGVLVKFLL